ncbi:hypothetical protein B0H14DRAFT_2269993, partial [Mycena olivaceomarginata]
RARACENCRFKYDGERPKCDQCSRSLIFHDCEYAEDGPTRTQVLQGRIRFLAGASVRSSCPSLRITFIKFFFFPLWQSINNFLHHSSQFGFFLNINNFREAIMGQSGQRPAAVLIDVVHLWAIHLSGSDEFTAHEARYISLALRAAVDAVTREDNYLHRIQGKLLLAHFFLKNGRILEGNYHLGAAVSLTAASGQCRIRSAEPLGHSTGFRKRPPPRDAMEECERISGLWAVLTLHACFTTADGCPGRISYTAPASRIDTPWPLDVLPASNFGTVATFLANAPDDGVSLAALHAKAAILFEEASRFSISFYDSFKSLDTLIERFKHRLPEVNCREMLVIHSLAHVAAIQLHNLFVLTSPPSRARALYSARAIVTAL